MTLLMKAFRRRRIVFPDIHGFIDAYWTLLRDGIPAFNYNP